MLGVEGPVARELRATRYAAKADQDLCRFIANELHFLDFPDTCSFYLKVIPRLKTRYDHAVLGCNDRFYLVTSLLNRRDAVHPWLFDRCREVEAEPDGHLDLWARFHYKSTFITLGGVIQEIMIDPEITISLFSVVKPIAQTFLSQIKDEFETNERLKLVYNDVLYADPKSKGVDGRPAKWGIARGITVKRLGKPKEATIEAHGLIDGQPTGRHFDMHVYDDVVTQDHLGEEQIKKTTERWEMADNLGSHDGVRKWMAGTRYHFADTYNEIIIRKSLKPRVYPATDDGTLTGKPVFLTEERWKQLKNDQRSTVSAQLLLNPIAGTESTFRATALTRIYDIFPAILNVYILIDPSKGRTQRSDRTAIAVIGIDVAGNKYLLDGVRHRMKLSDRWSWIKQFEEKWRKHPGVQMVRVGYEQYGMQSDLEVIEEKQLAENRVFEIVEMNTPSKGKHAKPDRIERIEPDIRGGRFYLPALVHHPDFNGQNEATLWRPWQEEDAKKFTDKGQKSPHNVGQITYWPMHFPTKAQKRMVVTLQVHRIVRPIKRRDENNDVYDVTRALIEELIMHPFAPHDDLADATSRIYDMEPIAPQLFETLSTEPIGDDIDEALMDS